MKRAIALGLTWVIAAPLSAQSLENDWHNFDSKQRLDFYSHWSDQLEKHDDPFLGLLEGHIREVEGTRQFIPLPDFDNNSEKTEFALRSSWRALTAQQSTEAVSWIQYVLNETDSSQTNSKLLSGIQLLISDTELLPEQIDDADKEDVAAFQLHWLKLIMQTQAALQRNDSQRAEAYLSSIDELRKHHKRLDKSYPSEQLKTVTETLQELVRSSSVTSEGLQSSFDLYRLAHTDADNFNIEVQDQELARSLFVQNWLNPNYPSRFHLSLMDGLQQRKALLQLANLGSQWIGQLSQEQQRVAKLKNDIATPDWLQSLQPGATFFLPEVLQLSERSRQLLVQWQQTAELYRRIELGRTSLESQQTLMQKGADVWLDTLTEYAQHMPATSAFNLDPFSPPSIDRLEAMLSEFLGNVPEDHESDIPRRYRLLNGLSLWQTGLPFQSPWWNNATVNLELSELELSLLMARRYADVRDLTEHHIQQKQAHFQALVRKAQTQTKQLEQELTNQKRALQAQLVADATTQLEKIDTIIAWYAYKSLPDLIALEELEQPVEWSAGYQEGQWVLTSVQTPERQLNINNTLVSVKRFANADLNSPNRLNNASLLANFLLKIQDIQSYSLSPMFSELDASLDFTIELLEKMARSEAFPESQKAALDYSLARAYRSNNQTQQAIRVMQRMVSTTDSQYFPRLPEILFRLGDELFRSGDYTEAARSFERLSKNFPESEYVETANYMLGWSWFKEGDFELALDHFFSLIDRYWGMQESTSAHAQRLIDDTLRVIGMTFANMDGADTIAEYFQKMGPQPYTEAIYADLGQYYIDRNRFTDAAKTYHTLLELFPASAQAPNYFSAIVEGYRTGSLVSLYWQEMERYAEHFRVDGEYWLTADAATRDLITEDLHQYLYDLGRRMQVLAQAEEAPSFDRALDYYQRLVELQPENTVLADTLLLMADIHTNRGEAEMAYPLYLQSAYQLGEFERGDEAGYGALLALQTLIANSADETQAGYLTESLKYGQAFIDTFPDSQYAAEVQVRIAEDYYLQGNAEQAYVLASARLQQTDILPALQIRLTRIGAHAAYATERFAEAEQLYARVSELPFPEQEVASLTARWAESIYRQGEQASQREETEAAVNHFLRIEETVPHSAIEAIAKLDASALLIQLQRWSEAQRELEDLRQRDIDDDMRKNVRIKLVVVYEETQQWPMAAAILNQLYGAEPDSAVGQDALWRSALLYDRSGDRTQAISTMTTIAEHPAAGFERQQEARFQLASWSAPAQATDWYLALLNQRNDEPDAATERTEFLASSAHLQLALSADTAFHQAAIVEPVAETLVVKQNHMLAAIEHYNALLDIGIAEHSTEAMARMAGLYSAMASALMASPRPAGLTELEAEQYEFMLEDQAFPLEDQAIALLENNVSWIQEDIFTPWIAQSLATLSELLPARYVKPEEVADYATELY